MITRPANTVLIAYPFCRKTDHPLGIAACAFLATAWLHGVGAAQRPEANPATPMDFQIPAQPLAAALQAYGQRTRVQVLYESHSAAGRQSTAVEGEFTSEAALNRLLTGTGLVVRYAKPDAITIALPSLRGADEPPADPLVKADLSIGELRVRASDQRNDSAPLQEYSASVQSDIEAALKRDSRTRSGNYRAELDLWINASRTIQKATLLKSTGDSDKDAAIMAALNGLTISRAVPPNTPQPVRIAIIVTASQ